MRDRLVDLLEEGNPDPSLRLKDDTPLISSGRIDSLALFRLVQWVERETDAKLDLTNVDLPKEWDTIADILDFVGRHRG